MLVREIRVDSPMFRDIILGLQKAFYRNTEIQFKIGDQVMFSEYTIVRNQNETQHGGYTGRSITVMITHVNHVEKEKKNIPELVLSFEIMKIVNE